MWLQRGSAVGYTRDNLEYIDRLARINTIGTIETISRPVEDSRSGVMENGSSTGGNEGTPTKGGFRSLLKTRCDSVMISNLDATSPLKNSLIKERNESNFASSKLVSEKYISNNTNSGQFMSSESVKAVGSIELSSPLASSDESVFHDAETSQNSPQFMRKIVNSSRKASFSAVEYSPSMLKKSTSIGQFSTERSPFNTTSGRETSVAETIPELSTLDNRTSSQLTLDTTSADYAIAEAAEKLVASTRTSVASKESSSAAQEQSGSTQFMETPLKTASFADMFVRSTSKVFSEREEVEDVSEFTAIKSVVLESNEIKNPFFTSISKKSEDTLPAIGTIDYTESNQTDIDAVLALATGADLKRKQSSTFKFSDTLTGSKDNIKQLTDLKVESKIKGTIVKTPSKVFKFGTSLLTQFLVAFIFVNTIILPSMRYMGYESEPVLADYVTRAIQESVPSIKLITDIPKNVEYYRENLWSDLISYHYDNLNVDECSEITSNVKQIACEFHRSTHMIIHGLASGVYSLAIHSASLIDDMIVTNSAGNGRGRTVQRIVKGELPV